MEREFKHPQVMIATPPSDCHSSPSKVGTTKHPNAAIPAGNRMPVELLAKIWGYVPNKSFVDACNLALVNEAFYGYFATRELWLKLVDTQRYRGFWGQLFSSSIIQRRHFLFQSGIKHNIWNSVELNRWYHELFTAGGIIRDRQELELPPEVWRHRQLLELVLQFVNVKAAPSMKDFRPYAKDKIIVLLFIERMPVVDCLEYVSSELMADKEVVLKAVTLFHQAISFCHSSLLNDREFIKRAVAANGHCIQFLGDYREDFELIIIASRASPVILLCARGQALKDIMRIGESWEKSWHPKRGQSADFVGIYDKRKLPRS